MEGQKLHSINHTANAFGVSNDTIWRLIKAKKLRSIRISRRVLVPESEITRILSSGVGVYAEQNAQSEPSL